MINSKQQRLFCVILVIIVSLVISTIYCFHKPIKNPAFDRAKQPNIVVIIADDLGWNDVGFHGSDQIPTPNIDALAYHGIILNRFYTQYTCTPSRAAFLTGNYPIRSGMQGYPLKGGENRSLPIDMPTMPEQLKKLGYRTHLVGKWHLGAAYRSSTPTGRGFDTHFGYWNGFIDYYNYISYTYGPNHSIIPGYDLHDGFDTVWEGRGHYATQLFADKATAIINEHDRKQPLFLVLSHLAPHTGKNGVELEVPDVDSTNQTYSYIEEPQRRFYAGVVSLLDQSVGKIVKNLADKDMLNNSIILFFSDNGAQTVGMYQNYGSNWPLRGVKFSEFEGGVRCAAAIFSPLFEKKGYVSNELVHLSDWLPTFYAAAGGDLENLGNIDGINQWDSLSKEIPSNRSEILLNINEVDNSSAIIADRGNYKYLQGTYHSGIYDGYYGDSGRNSRHNSTAVLESEANSAIALLGLTITPQIIHRLRLDSDISWCREDSHNPSINCTEGCLFDLHRDPCETTNIITSNPLTASRLKKRLQDFAFQIVPQKNNPTDLRANPIFYNNTWCTWLEDDLCVKTPLNNNKLISGYVLVLICHHAVTTAPSGGRHIPPGFIRTNIAFFPDFPADFRFTIINASIRGAKGADKGPRSPRVRIYVNHDESECGSSVDVCDEDGDRVREWAGARESCLFCL